MALSKSWGAGAAQGSGVREVTASNCSGAGKKQDHEQSHWREKPHMGMVLLLRHISCCLFLL